MILTLCLESEQHTTDQNATFPAEMVYFSKNALFCVWQFGKEKTCLYNIYNDLDACNEFRIILLYILPCIYIYIYTHYLTNPFFSQ